MDYIIPSRGKRRRIIAERVDETDGKKDANDSTTNIINRGRTSSVGGSTAASTAASDTDEGEEDPLAEEESQLQNEIILKKWQRANGEGDEDQLLHTSSRAKLFEYVKSNDEDDEDGAWTFRGEGQVKFIRCLEEGYNRGMIRMELTKNFTLETLMCHEITTEDAMPMNSKKGKAYTWFSNKDWAYITAKKTFAIRFDDSLQALEWKQMFESSKANNCNVRRGVGVPDAAAVDDVCNNFNNLGTVSSGAASK